jgi:hypothetical protein
MDPRDPRSMNAAFDACWMGMDDLEYFGAIGVGPSRTVCTHKGPIHLDTTKKWWWVATSKILIILCEGLKHPMRKHACSNADAHFRHRANLLVQFVNGQITYAARYDGRFPPDFRTTKTVEEVKVIDRKWRILSTYLGLLIILIATALDRILRAYVLPTGLRSLRLTSRDPVSTKTAH